MVAGRTLDRVQRKSRGERRQADGTGSRSLARNGWYPSWAPSSRALVFGRQTPRGEIVVTVRLDGTGERPLLELARDEHPGWSPGGRKIVFARDCSVHVIDPDGSALRAVGVRACDAAFAPDGNRLVGTRAGDLVVFTGEGRVLRRVQALRDPVDHLPYVLTSPAWSPDGRTIVYGAREQIGGCSDLYAVTAADGTQRRLTTHCGSGIDDALDPSWSPDGARIAYVDGEAGIAIVAADGTGKRVLTPSIRGVRNGNPAWSPDGSRIVFDRTAGSRDTQIYVTDAGGGRLQQLTTSGGSQPDLQPVR